MPDVETFPVDEVAADILMEQDSSLNSSHILLTAGIGREDAALDYFHCLDCKDRYEILQKVRIAVFICRAE